MPNVYRRLKNFVRMLYWFLLRGTAVGLMAALLSSCTASYGTSGGSGDPSGGGSGDPSGGTSPVVCLRAPDIGATSPPVLTPDQQTRADEVCQYLNDLYKQQGWEVQYTVEMPSHDIYDWLTKTSIPGSDATPPPEMPGELTLPPGVEPLLTELTMFPELRGPTDTLLKVRPNFSLYISGATGAPTLSDFIAKYQPSGSPTGGGRLYAGISSTNDPKNNPTYNVGASASLMPYPVTIEPGTLSLFEMAVGCRNLADGEMLQQVGVAASSDYKNIGYPNFGDSVLRLQVEFLTATDKLTGPGKGGWEGTVTHDFILNKDSPYAPGMILFPSVVGGKFPVESSFWIRQWNGNWWIGYNGSWIGYYRGDLFNGELAEHGCEVLWYGEVYNPGYDPDTKTPAPNWPPMGSGHYAEETLEPRSYFRNPSYIDMSLTTQWADKGGVMSKDLYRPNCYTQSLLTPGSTPFDWMIFLGGLGGSGGNCPPPAP